jgi:hypothetical protein
VGEAAGYYRHRGRGAARRDWSAISRARCARRGRRRWWRGRRWRWSRARRPAGRATAHSGSPPMIRYAMLCYAVLCCAMLCYAMRCDGRPATARGGGTQRARRARHARYAATATTAAMLYYRSTMICDAPCRIIPPPVPRRRSIISSRPRGAGGYFAFRRPACQAFSARSSRGSGTRRRWARKVAGVESGARDGRDPRRIARMDADPYRVSAGANVVRKCVHQRA